MQIEKAMRAEEKWLYLVIAALGMALLWKLAPILSPFLISAILAYLGDPLVDWLERRGVGRNSAVVLTFAALLILFSLGLIIILPLVYDQILQLIEKLPEIFDSLWNQHLSGIAVKLGIIDESMLGTKPDIAAFANLLKAHWNSLDGILGIILQGIGRSGETLMLALSYVLIVPVVTFYALRDWDKLLAQGFSLIPPRFQSQVGNIAKECDSALGSFLRGQLWVMLALAAVYSSGLAIAGIDFALLTGAFAGLISFVPYLGGILGVATASAIAAFQYQDIIHIVYVLIVFGVGQALEGMALTPLLVGNRIRMHPLAIIFAIMAGGQLFGFFGILLALPVAAVLTVLLRHLLRRYLASPLHS